MRLLFLALLLFAAPAHAHTRSQSSSSWIVQGDNVRVEVQVAAIDITRLYALGGEAPLEETLKAHVASSLSMEAGGVLCARVGDVDVRAAPNGVMIAALRFHCAPGALENGAVSLHSALFHAVAPSHLHFAALRDAQGRRAEAVLTERHPTATLTLESARAESTLQAGARFVRVGAEHVWGGLDHVAFILSLTLLCAGRLRSLIWAATGFTLGHSGTLALAALGWVHPNAGAVEALIGFTIAFVALETGEDGAARLRAWSIPMAAALCAASIAAAFRLGALPPMIWAGLAAFVFAYPRGFPQGPAAAPFLAIAFGLIHGCGFAGALNDLDLPQPRLLSALLGFNVGVEIGQATIIAAALAALWMARRLTAAPVRARLAQAAAAALFGLGVFWMTARAFLI